MTQTTPTKDKIAEAKRAARECSVSDPLFAVNLKHMRDFILNDVEALAGQLAEAQTNLRAAKRIECDVCEKRIALNHMVSDLGQKHQQAESAAASARETALEEAKAAIRRGCQACEGTGYADQNAAPGQESECEYCGRPRDAIEALKSTPAPVTPSDERTTRQKAAKDWPRLQVTPSAPAEADKLQFRREVLAARLKVRLDVCVEREGSEQAAITSKGVAISYLFAQQIHRALLPSPPIAREGDR